MVNQGEYSDQAQDGVLVQCEYMAHATEVEFTVDPDTNATWHLYGFSNAEVSSLLQPTLYLDNTNPAALSATLEWPADVTEFTVDDLNLSNATVGTSRRWIPRAYLYHSPASNLTTITLSIAAATLKVGGEDNEEFVRNISTTTTPSPPWPPRFPSLPRMSAKPRWSGLTRLMRHSPGLPRSPSGRTRAGMAAMQKADPETRPTRHRWPLGKSGRRDPAGRRG